MALSNLGLEVTQCNSVLFTKSVVKTSGCQGGQTETPPHNRRNIKAIRDRFFKTTQLQRHRETFSCLSWLLKSKFFSFCLSLRRKHCQVKRINRENSFKAKMQSLGSNTETSVGLGDALSEWLGITAWCGWGTQRPWGSLGGPEEALVPFSRFAWRNYICS